MIYRLNYTHTHNARHADFLPRIFDKIGQKICGEKWPLYIFLFTSNLLTPAFLSFKPIAFQPSETEAWGQNGKFTTRTFSFTWVGEMLGIFAGIEPGTGISPMTLYEIPDLLCAVI